MINALSSHYHVKCGIFCTHIHHMLVSMETTILLIFTLQRIVCFTLLQTAMDVKFIDFIRGDESIGDSLYHHNFSFQKQIYRVIIPLYAVINLNICTPNIKYWRRIVSAIIIVVTIAKLLW